MSETYLFLILAGFGLVSYFIGFSTGKKCMFNELIRMKKEYNKYIDELLKNDKTEDNE